MRRALPARFWVEVTAASVCAALLLVTVVWPDWIELVFHVDPDRGDGSVEWTIVIASVLVTVALALLARFEWRRARIMTG